MNSAAMMNKLEEMNQRLHEMERMQADMHAALVTAMSKLGQAELMLTMHKVQLVGNGPTEV